MADDDRPLIDPRLFTPTELLAEDMDHSIDVGDTSVDVHHTVEIEIGERVPVRRLEVGAIAFGLLVVAFGVLAPVGAVVAVSAALSTVLVGNVLLRSLAR